MTPEFKAALGGLAQIPQWFVWRLEWNPEERKYNKVPWVAGVGAVDSEDPQFWMSYDEAVQRVVQMRAGLNGVLTYTLGFRFTEGCGYWFFDLDECAVDGVLDAHASEMVQRFPGAMVEWSSSARGVHVFGKGECPEHSTKHKPTRMEFYTKNRGCAFGLAGVCSGSADTNHDQAVRALINEYFKPSAVRSKLVGGRHADWRGPEDDEELIRRALRAKKSAESFFGGKASFEQLWMGQATKDSEHDLALASHLAFWTGCDAERMERLMRQSGMMREKWNEHRTYLVDLTIAKAIDGCERVYQEPVKSVAAQQEMYGTAPVTIITEGATPIVIERGAAPSQLVSPEMMARVEELLDEVTSCGTFDEMHNTVIPKVREAAIPRAIAERLANAINKRLEFWNGKLPIAQVRALICPPVVAGSGGSQAPEWAMRHCYVQEDDGFFDLASGVVKTRNSFNAEYERMMPMKDNGAREDAAEWALNRWQISVVQRKAYRPDQPEFFAWDGAEYVNLYTTIGIPEPCAFTEAGIRGIEAFKTMLWGMCNQREYVYTMLLNWIAHNVQQPGVKIRWSPILKGCPGDGKSLITEVLRAAMGGSRHVAITGNATLTASGGFTDWATGCAVNVLEEIMIRGREQYRLYNLMKEFITNNVVSINPKGKVKYQTFNTTNHLALTNHNDGLPMEDDDRRWMVVFSPWLNRQQMRELCGGPETVKAMFKAIDYAYKHCAGEFRAWFLSITMDGRFDRDDEAPMTPEKLAMITTSKDDAETIAARIIEEGMVGITARALCSASLTQAMKIACMSNGVEIPKTTSLAHMLTRMGFTRHPKILKWKDKARTIWIRNGISDDPEKIREILDMSNS
jgi:hypothetical protein